MSKANEKLNIQVNPDLNLTLSSGDKIFYIADKRITKLNWADFVEAESV